MQKSPARATHNTIPVCNTPDSALSNPQRPARTLYQSTDQVSPSICVSSIWNSDGRTAFTLRKLQSSPTPGLSVTPFFFIKKRDGKLRPVQDYRRINNFTIRNQYPLPLISELIANLSGAHIFSKLDVRWGYNNVRIKEGDEHKAVFKTKYGLWEPMVMFFSLTNSPATFQAMMDSIYRPVVKKWAQRGTRIEKYMDDIAIATSTNDADHTEAVMDVLQVAKDNDLYFKPEKCVFHASRIDYLGVILEKGMIRMDPVKIEGIKNWPMPTKVKDIRSFLGFCNFY